MERLFVFLLFFIYLFNYCIFSFITCISKSVYNDVHFKWRGLAFCSFGFLIEGVGHIFGTPGLWKVSTRGGRVGMFFFSFLSSSFFGNFTSNTIRARHFWAAKAMLKAHSLSTHSSDWGMCNLWLRDVQSLTKGHFGLLIFIANSSWSIDRSDLPRRNRLHWELQSLFRLRVDWLFHWRFFVLRFHTLPVRKPVKYVF